ncbi:orotidine-5'-phosphate decarboxylase [Pelagibacteraceae bacterium]|nr:orotidine-5'-phosphate decarboxylase [Pelagibacteraceae bacterium]
MKKPKIFIACDTNNPNEIKKIIKNTKTNKLNIGYKFGLEFFLSKQGRNFVSKLKKEEIFLDLKLNDIPNTCSAAIYSLKDLKNISFLTVHINGGFEMLKIIKNASKKINKKIKILGVTVLTSFTNSSIKKIGHTRSIGELVKKQVALAKSAKLDGIVCSGYEAKLIKNICAKMEIVTPGIRLKGDSSDDQKRIMSPKNAFENGATAIVMGRSITKGNIKNNIKKLIKSLN